MDNEANIFHIVQEGSLERLTRFTGDVNVKDKCGMTPLEYLIADGRLDCMKHLVEKLGAHVNHPTGGCGPIHVAAISGTLNCMTYLVECCGVNVNTNSVLYTPLTLAISHEHFHCVEYLIAKGAFVDGSPGLETPLQSAGRKGDTRTIKLLLSKGADPSCVLPFRVHNTKTVWNFISEVRRTFKEKQAIQAMMSVKIHPRLGLLSSLKVLPAELIQRLHAYIV
jgi:ankyrin repeat protein